LGVSVEGILAGLVIFDFYRKRMERTQNL